VTVYSNLAAGVAAGVTFCLLASAVEQRVRVTTFDVLVPVPPNCSSDAAAAAAFLAPRGSAARQSKIVAVGGVDDNPSLDRRATAAPVFDIEASAASVDVLVDNCKGGAIGVAAADASDSASVSSADEPVDRDAGGGVGVPSLPAGATAVAPMRALRHVHTRVFTPHGNVFFGTSTSVIADLLHWVVPDAGPGVVAVDMAFSGIVDISAVQALDKVARHLAAAGKQMVLLNLSDAAVQRLDDAQQLLRALRVVRGGVVQHSSSKPLVPQSQSQSQSQSPQQEQLKQQRGGSPSGSPSIDRRGGDVTTLPSSPTLRGVTSPRRRTGAVVSPSHDAV
jgi:MFS superfamily sulfate permease-like transporter